MAKIEMETLARAAQVASSSLRFEQLLKGTHWLIREQQEALDQMKIEAVMGASKDWPGAQIAESLGPICHSPSDRNN